MLYKEIMQRFEHVPSQESVLWIKDLEECLKESVEFFAWETQIISTIKETKNILEGILLSLFDMFAISKNLFFHIIFVRSC